MSTAKLALRAPRVAATADDLPRQLREAGSDLSRCLVAPLRRSRHCTWGATEAEVAAPMPGDDLLAHPQYRSTRAVTIDAPPEAVWPWLIQVGCDRAGWYANDLLDNFGHPSSRRILPEFQHIEVGQWLTMVPEPSQKRSFIVDGFSKPDWLLWRTPIRSWGWRLIPLANGQTRLISRMYTRYDWRRPGAMITVMLMEFGDYPMMRRMLLGIKDRAEAERQNSGHN
jgi:hypothetical protein